MPKLDSKYGHFSDDGRAYVVTRPDTPMPWINVLTNGDYGLTISQAGSGYSWRTHASLNRITRWEQDLIRDEWGKYVYIRDDDSGEFWSPTPQPCGSALEDFSATHGMGYTTIEARRGTLESSITTFVPMDAPCEVWLLKLRNTEDAPRRLQIFTYFEWLLGAAPDSHREFHRTFIETEYDAAHGALLATKVMWELPVESKTHWNREWEYVAFHGASVQPGGFDADKRDFLGRHGHLSAPQAVREGKSSGQAGRWGDAIASLRLDVTLAAGETAEVAFTLGAADDRESALKTVDRFKDLGAAQKALDKVRRFWTDIVTRLAVETPDAALNVMGNGWLAYQAVAGRLFGRSAYYQTGGAFGFRDQLQDSLVWLQLGLPDKTLEQIKFHAAHQYQDGVVLHWWHPIADTGLRSEYSDDLLWLPFVMLRYLHETGDLGALDAKVDFYDGGFGMLRDHCQRAFRVALERRSARGLPLILKADWNDGLNAVGVEGRGESTFMAHFLVFLLRGWAALPSTGGETAARYLREADAIHEAVNTHAWDGEWYWRATTDAGRVIGSKSCEEGKIFLNAQTWAVLSGTADDERARRAMQSAREHLYTDYGALLLAPGYSKPDAEIGYLTRYAPGIRENGGVYSHAACWAVLAERKLNGADAAYRLWHSFCPPARSLRDPDCYAGEPYVMPGNVAGPQAAAPGQAGWTWYTGSSGWMLTALVEGVFGVEAQLKGLRVTPGLPGGWNEARIRRIFRGVTYEIMIQRGGAAGCTVDGRSWDGEFLPVGAAGETMRVEFSV